MTSTINQLHNKLEYERQIQDQLLLQQQKEIESLELKINEKQNECKELKKIENKYSESKKINLEIKNKLNEMEILNQNKSKELSEINDKLHSLQIKYENIIEKIEKKNDEIDELKQKNKCLKNDNIELTQNNTNLDRKIDDLQLKNESLQRQINLFIQQQNEMKQSLFKNNEEIKTYQQQIKTFDNLLKDKCLEIDNLENKIKKIKESHKYEINTLQDLIDNIKYKTEQEIFQIESKYFSAKEIITNYQQIERDYKILKKKFNQIKSKYNEQDFELNKKLMKITRLNQENGDQNILIRKIKMEKNSINDSLSHYKIKCQSLKKEIDFNKQIIKNIPNLQEKINNLNNENLKLKNNLTQILSQPTKISCSYHKQCSNQLCNKPQYGLISLPLNQLNQLKHTKQSLDINIHNDNDCDCNRRNRLKQLRDLVQDRRHLRQC